MAKTIQLTKGYETIVDDDVYVQQSPHKWQAHVTPNGVDAKRTASRRLGKYVIYLHREVLGISHLSYEVQADHIDHDTLDNRRSNLRIATNQQNNQNRQLDPRSKTGVRGVTFIKSRNKYRASISRHYQFIFIGYYDTVAEAAAAVEAESKRYD